MISIRKSQDRGHATHGWLDSHFSFSFAEYYDPQHMGFSSLRVINEDWIAPSKGFPTHPHRDMEIVTYLLEGALEHRDTLGTGSVITPGEVQRMSAGTGIAHSEFNPSASERCHLLQIWMLPAQRGLSPSYEQKRFADAEKQNRLCLIAAPDGRDGAVSIQQDAYIYASLLETGASVTHTAAPGRKLYLQIVRGEIEKNGHHLQAGDGARIWEETEITLTGRQPAEFLLFDLAP